MMMSGLKKSNKIRQLSSGKKSSPKTSFKPTQEKTKEIFRRLQNATPNPKTELHYTNPFTLLVAVVLSAQSTDQGVNRATKELFKLADTPQKMVELGESKVRNYVKTIGLYKNKAKNIIKLSEQLLLQHQGEVPHDREALQALAGVGRKTANVILNVAFGEPTLAVDTHVFRLAHRLGLSRGKTPENVEKDLLALVPPDYAHHAHHWLILHGRYVCKSRTPLCPNCILRDLCPFNLKNQKKHQ